MSEPDISASAAAAVSPSQPAPPNQDQQQSIAEPMPLQAVLDQHQDATASATSAAPVNLDLDLSVVQDPILDLCPSLDILKQIARSSTLHAQVKKDKLSKALLRAASNGDTDMLSWLLDSRAEARQIISHHPSRRDSQGRPRIAFEHIRDEEGTGPVVLATCAGHIDAVTMLILNGAEIDERDACGWTPLMWATNSSNLPLASFLLSRGADVDAKSTRGTTCEDFILSAAPEAATSMAPAQNHAATTEQEAIADLIYEHQRYISSQQSAAQRLNGLYLDTSPDCPKPLSSSLQNIDPDRQSSAAVSPTRSSRSSIPSSSSPFKPGHSRTGSQLTQRRLVGRYERAHLVEQKNKQKELSDTRKSALADIATLLELDLDTLTGEPAPSESNAGGSGRANDPSSSSSLFARRRRGAAAKTAHTDLASGCGAAEVGADLLSVEFDWKSVRSDQMLVFGNADLDPLLSMLITNMRPIRAPWTSRAAPANVLFLCARYACLLQDEDLLEELFLGAIDRIEGVIYSHPTDMTYLAFWLSNCCLLHYYMDKDRTLRKSSSVREYRSLLADLLNEISVFIIRDAERRIDKVLDAAMLDHEAIPGFEEVRFEGEWKFMKTLAGSVKGIGQQSSLSQGMNSSASSRRPISQIFGTGRKDDASSNTTPEGSTHLSSSPSLGNGRPLNPFGSATVGPSSSSFRNHAGGDSSLRKGLGESFRAIRHVSNYASATDLLTAPTPRTISSLLRSTLQVLQFYEINPAIIIQALSQIFFWVGCELFNRVITRKRYLCRSRAIQIRMNVSALEDWARSNALPLSIVHAHLSPLSQLISWLQCQSSLQEFDGLIATMQGLKALTPVQMRRVVKDYRYEVGETRMSEECLQYLDQLIIDWRRRQDEQLRQAKEEARKVQMRKSKVKKQNSGHARHGTARQEDYTPESRSLDEKMDEENEQDEDEDEDEDDMGLKDGMADKSINSTGTAKVSKEDSEPLTVAEATVRSAQLMIDELFMPGKSMSDYVPPWTAAGSPLGLHDDGTSSPGSAPPSPTKADGLLNSREMLPFALPTKRNALIVTPGDAFGFGRGHFTGTGTPSVRSVNGDSNAPSTSSSRRSSIVSSSSHPSSIPADTTLTGAGGEDEEIKSETSSHTDASGVSQTSSLFPQGKGFAAGGYWSPVPLLPEGMLDRIDAMLKAAAAVVPSIGIGDRSRNILLADHASDEHLPLHQNAEEGGMGLPRSSRIVIPLRENSMLQSSPIRATQEKGGIIEYERLHLNTSNTWRGDEMEEEDAKTPGPYRKDTLKPSLFST
ncbi:hypothetical protein NDA10_002688 [Ustilago hordei]|uniref:Dilute domain-containing protein n=1 Tax=Ustilago hordei TaxID=120017 RepID=I2G4J4_USTHO|nr:uncharacterized protein UHO2_01229 [Ustilago hordei]KAJ1044511.1 hypothetical protein NDA10_002688 [Ustilago hordei]KAJ1583769.1 hypothetical protein NDA15_006628 [Ustilago hordei]KAJ1591956.1 hypothetical protein NDA12_004329 [Ustilago hordei]UTT94862.1 hypothetical protein NDA17_004293 [Ustilago hordei]CCF54087.1 uncharacterized protein UHOR_00548 [Ustilago hordei]